MTDPPTNNLEVLVQATEHCYTPCVSENVAVQIEQQICLKGP